MRAGAPNCCKSDRTGGLHAASWHIVLHMDLADQWTAPSVALLGRQFAVQEDTSVWHGSVFGQRAMIKLGNSLKHPNLVTEFQSEVPPSVLHTRI